MKTEHLALSSSLRPSSGISRRGFVASLGAGVLGVGVAVTTGGCKNMTTSAGSSTDKNKPVSAPLTTCEVQTKPGTILGFVDQGVSTFRGIPYATARRFENPVLIDRYAPGMQNAFIYGPVAPQDRTLSATAQVNPFEFFTPSNGTADMVGNENCQYLNVWSGDVKGKRPVLVFFHGGGLSNGASTELSAYEGHAMARDHGVVFVSVNTRLNVLGFLDLSEYGEQFAESGIAGMKDGVAALTWVRDNIANFGGDPDNITIIGQSGGGNKVTTLSCMTDAEGLFNRVVMMSGYYATGSQEDGRANTQKLIDYLQLPSEKVAETLVSMPYEQLFEAATKAGCAWNVYPGTGTFTQPFIDPATGAVNPLAAKRTWMIGTAFSEFTSNAAGWFAFQRKEVPFANLPSVSDDDARSELTKRYEGDAEAFAQAFGKAYPGHQLAEALWLSPLEGPITRYGMVGPKGVVTLLNESGIPVFNYVTAYRQPALGGITMSHSGDIAFMFDNTDHIAYLVRGDEEGARLTAKAMSSALAAFCEKGDPSTTKLAWVAHESSKAATMVFEAKSEVRVGHDQELLDIMAKHPQKKG